MNTTIPQDRYPCELCETQRPDQPRAFGVDFIIPDGYWACAECIAIFKAGLVPGTRKEAGVVRA